MVSEDSDELVSGLSPVHRLHDLSDLSKTLMGLVPAVGQQLDTRGELLEVEPFRRSERMLLKEWDNPLEQISSATNRIAVQVLPVVVLPPVDVHLSHSEELA